MSALGALFEGDIYKAWGALAVLGTSVAFSLVAGTLTLIVQRRLGHRARAPAGSPG